MNTLNKLLARWGLKLTRTDGIGDFALLQERHQELMERRLDGMVRADALRAEINELERKLAEIEADIVDLREQNKELKRKLACKTASEYYWKKQAKEARG